MAILYIAMCAVSADYCYRKWCENYYGTHIYCDHEDHDCSEGTYLHPAAQCEYESWGDAAGRIYCSSHQSCTHNSYTYEPQCVDDGGGGGLKDIHYGIIFCASCIAIITCVCCRGQCKKKSNRNGGGVVNPIVTYNIQTTGNVGNVTAQIAYPPARRDYPSSSARNSNPAPESGYETAQNDYQVPPHIGYPPVSYALASSSTQPDGAPPSYEEVTKGGY